jgi:aspartate carbamoyltransferase catalytic subunit
MHSFLGSDFVTVKGVERADYELIFDVAREMEEILRSRTRSALLEDKILGLMFFQVSTRTRTSFESAMTRLKGGVVGFADPKTTRAGDYYQESLYDVTRMMEHYADVLVMRHPTEGAPAEAASFTDVPVISGGDGYNEHPTQALLDMYTILRERGSLERVNIALVGDMNMRVMHSLALALAQYRANVALVSPKEDATPKEWLEEYDRAGLNYQEVYSIDDVIEDMEVAYMVGVKPPDFHIGRSEAAKVVHETPAEFLLDRKKLSRAREDMIILHPLPRKTELPKDVDTHASSRYFVQAYYGVAVRMALLALILGKAP